jgi:pimeloyl-ACP methyl ester carboxylesterase
VAEDKGDIFAGFILRVGRVITDLQARNVATRGRVIAVGVSRGGYLAFRLAISDPRVTDVIALAPVTDLQRLREFAAVKVDEANRLDLTFLLEPLVGHATSEHERAAAWALSPSPGLGASPPPPR